MASHQYHKISPTSNSLNGFQEAEPISFLIKADPDRSLKNNSVAIEFELSVFQTGTTPNDNGVLNDICLGSSSVFFKSFSVESQQKGKIETLLNYPRYCNILNNMQKSTNDKFNTDSYLEGDFELRGNKRVASQRNCTANTGTALFENANFVIKPKFCLNKQLGGNYDFKDGYLIVNTILESNIHALYGLYSATTDASYQINKICLRYETLPTALASPLPQLCQSYQCIKADVNAQNNMISALVPAQNCTGFIMSFIAQTRSNTFLNDSNKLEVLRGIQSVRFIFNSNLGERITYDMEDISEMEQQAINLIKQEGTNGSQRQKMKNNDNFVLGVEFKSILDLSNTNVQVQINLDSSYSNDVHNCYLYFLQTINLS